MLCHVFWSQVEYKIVCFISDSAILETRMRPLSKVYHPPIARFSVDIIDPHAKQTPKNNIPNNLKKEPLHFVVPSQVMRSLNENR